MLPGEDCYDDKYFDDILLYGTGVDEFISDCFDKHIWLTVHMTGIYVSKMTDEHLSNALQFCQSGHKVYGLAEQWIPVLQEEINRRLEE
jgi:hypothetical protein